ncbi:MAG: molybdopterin molybdotransferase MoeA [Acidobacteriota bacterium]|nr:MAG: molybdopterin molybdotransferase MoeA [Acidobacteriota bacterium]
MGPALVPVAEAYRAVIDSVETPPPVRAPLEEALHMALAEGVTADADSPPFDRAMMDGYALRSDDAERTLRVVDVIAAGAYPRKEIRRGECAQIMTGAPLPPGADAVQMVEKTKKADGGRVEILEAAKRGRNVSPRAEEFHKGDTVAPAGALVTPAVMAVLASVGAAEISVHPKPRIALFSTGSELVEIFETPEPGKIRNTNAFSLPAQLREAGLSVSERKTLRDDPEEIRAAVRAALESHDVVVLTGGVSVGEFDYVVDALEDAGVEVLFRKVAVKPGKPLVFGTAPDGRLIFSLPGNPVSSVVLMHLFVLPALRKRLGVRPWDNPRVGAALESPLRVKPNELTKYLPAALSCREGAFTAAPVAIRGSADIFHFSEANALVEVPPDSSGWEKGEKAPAIPLGAWTRALLRP